MQFSDIDATKDSTLALMLAAQEMGWDMECILAQDLWIEQGSPGARSRKIKVWDDSDRWCEFGEPRRRKLEEYDVLLLRIDPPVNSDYIYAMQVAEIAEEQGVRVINKPSSICAFNEKIIAVKFSELMPPHLLSTNIQQLVEFHNRNDASVFKPLDGMGGDGIFMVNKGDLNLNTVLSNLTGKGQHLVMAQEYIPDILKGGDKRVLMFYADPFPRMLVRLPNEGDFRANMAAGGTYAVEDISDAEIKVCNRVSPFLLKHGLDFVGLDIIGGFLSEINITCPTGLRQIAAKSKVNPAGSFLQKVQKELQE